MVVQIWGGAENMGMVVMNIEHRSNGDEHLRRVEHWYNDDER